MKTGTFDMTLNLDGYTSLDGWLTLNGSALLAADRHYAVVGSIDEHAGLLQAVVTVHAIASAQPPSPFHFDAVRLEGSERNGGFVLQGRHEGVDIELRLHSHGT